jgi:hypothetical protein
VRPQTYVTNSVEQSRSWEANNRSLAGQEIPRILWNRNIHYRIHKSPPPVPVLGQIDLVHDAFHLLEDPFQYFPPIYVWVFQMVVFPQDISTSESHLKPQSG